jgi:hypothetical protein
VPQEGEAAVGFAADPLEPGVGEAGSVLDGVGA